MSQLAVEFVNIDSLRLRVEPKELFSDWYVEDVSLVNFTNGNTWRAIFNCWLKEGETEKTIKAKPEVKEMTIATLKDNESKIKTGDVILYGHVCLKSQIIKLATGSPYSHIGIIYKNDQGELLVYESTLNGDDTHDVLYETPYPGVHLFMLNERAMSYNGKIWHLPLKEKLTKQQEVKLIAFLSKCHAQKVPFDWKGVITACWDEFVGKTEEKSEKESIFSSVFAAELVTRALQEVGLLNASFNPHTATPHQVSALPIFDSASLTVLKEVTKK